MLQEPYTLDAPAREVVLAAIRKHCVYRGWYLFAAHIRSNHGHVIVDSEAAPERILIEFKAYASRELNQLGRDRPGRKRWAEHGSTRWLWEEGAIDQALRYVVKGQGEPMALFVSDDL
jgi:hypothetical protein